MKQLPTIKLKTTIGAWTAIRWETVPARRGPMRMLVVRCSCGSERRIEPSYWVRAHLPQFCKRCLVKRENKRLARRFFLHS